MSRAVVTGAASGIGLATATQLARQGHSVLAVDRNAELLTKAAELGMDTLAADVTSAGERAAICGRAGACDYLVNSAGVIDVSLLAEATEAQWARMFSVNAEACFFLTQSLAGQLSDGGAIVNVSSQAAKTAEAEAAIYAASKAAVLSITRSFARELAPRGIRVNSVSPGIIETPMQGAFLPSFAAWAGKDEAQLQRERIRDVPLGRIGIPEDVARVVCLLLSDDCGYVTGEDVNVGGGLVYW